jgi:hypothetical protein
MQRLQDKQSPPWWPESGRRFSSTRVGRRRVIPTVEQFETRTLMTSGPTVTAVSATTADGVYGTGSVIAITVDWSASVRVVGMAQLALNSGGTASYSSGSGTSELAFSYTVAAGQNSPKLDYTSTSALRVNNGSIFGITSQSAADLNLPAPGAAGSLAGSKSIAIDTTAPMVNAVSSTTANGTYGVGSVITLTVDWS